VDTSFELIDKIKVVHGESLETTRAQIRNVGRNVRHPAEISNRRGTVWGNWPRLGILRRPVERNVELSVKRDLSAVRIKREIFARLVFEEPVAAAIVYIPHSGLHRDLTRLCMGISRGRFSLCGLRLRLACLLFRGLGVGGVLRLRLQ